MKIEGEDGKVWEEEELFGDEIDSLERRGKIFIFKGDQVELRVLNHSPSII